MRRAFALDVSRLIWRSWSRRVTTGIDRVCYAYLDHFRDRSQAVVQHWGRPRILSAEHSDRLFDMLLESDAQFRRRLTRFAPSALAYSKSRADCRNAFYLNVGHTDIDLDPLMHWLRARQLRPIYLIHDLIPLTHPEFCRPAAVKRHRGRVENALRHAAGIITNSEASANEIARYADERNERCPPVLAALLAGAALATPATPTPVSRPYFVCVGTIEGRKNHALLLRVWRRLIERFGREAPRLVIIGQWGAEAGHVEEMLNGDPAIHEHVIHIADCSDRELGGWISSALALLMPSFAEGFGLPLVEALQLGTPVIASDRACFREIGDGIPTFLDPHDTGAWERAIIAFTDHGLDRNRQLRLVQDYQPPSWKTHFDRVEQWLAALPSEETPARAYHAADAARGRAYGAAL